MTQKSEFPFSLILRVYSDPEKQEKWNRIEMRRLVRSRLGLRWRDFEWARTYA